ncbi:MAG: Na(+)/H(+) antiporter subunit C [Trueperella sp.]|uniref:Na(+)/H(+) antiporter subunit C n=1 Tax=Trueperella TaxID=1069494 RepID=UPI0025FA83B9|nr:MULTISPECIES: Na(+)/H(+) antiporter subunit C [Trueperella]MCI7306558.1 Na(+)/H(+) antiporter subunit C [Trueperella sp.]MDY5403417.1 Na(+)/H(+) antiporter subunit C [Trueperella sp.]
MSFSLALAIVSGVLVAVGVYLVLERSLSRIVLGLAVLTNGVNILMLIAGGPSGAPPMVGEAAQEDMADPLVQAMMLTAIVISLALTGFLLALAYRSWQLNASDEVQDDLEDRRIANRTEEAKFEARTDKPADLEDDAPDIRDETDDEPDSPDDAAPAAVRDAGSAGDPMRAEPHAANPEGRDA